MPSLHLPQTPPSGRPASAARPPTPPPGQPSCRRPPPAAGRGHENSRKRAVIACRSLHCVFLAAFPGQAGGAGLVRTPVPCLGGPGQRLGGPAHAAELRVRACMANGAADRCCAARCALPSKSIPASANTSQYLQLRVNILQRRLSGLLLLQLLARQAQLQQRGGKQNRRQCWGRQRQQQAGSTASRPAGALHAGVGAAPAQAASAEQHACTCTNGPVFRSLPSLPPAPHPRPVLLLTCSFSLDTSSFSTSSSVLPNLVAMMTSRGLAAPKGFCGRRGGGGGRQGGQWGAGRPARSAAGAAARHTASKLSFGFLSGAVSSDQARAGQAALHPRSGEASACRRASIERHKLVPALQPSQGPASARPGLPGPPVCSGAPGARPRAWQRHQDPGASGSGGGAGERRKHPGARQSQT